MNQHKLNTHISPDTSFALTQQMQRSLQILAAPSTDLGVLVQAELDQNPCLISDDFEEAPTESLSDAEPLEQTDEFWQSSSSPSGEPGREDFSFELPKSDSLHHHLSEQISTLRIPAEHRAIAEYLAGCLEEDGYLKESLEDILARVSQQFQADYIDIALLETGLSIVQKLDPVGVGARSLGECLALQIRAARGLDSTLAEKALVVAANIHLLGKKDFRSLRKLLMVDELLFEQVLSLINGLEPRPGERFNYQASQYVVPDVLVKKVNDKWHVQLNPEAMPKVKVHNLYAQLIRDQDNSQVIRSKMSEAKAFVKHLNERFKTILRVSEAIVKEQQGFLESGEKAMKPLVLRQIAEALGMHESTVSRATSEKYMATPLGTFELKYFFCSAISTSYGDTLSAPAARTLIRDIVNAEDKRNPYSDSDIAKKLSDRGLVIARRTIAKYRETMQIASAHLRRTA